MTSTNLFFDYLNSVGSNCPFLLPALRKKGVFCRITVVLTEDTMDDIAQICWDAQHEIVNQLMVKTDQEKNNFISINIVIKFPSIELEEDLGEAYTSIAHEILRDIYLPHDILCGKFWRGEKITTTNGVDISSSPVTFISIRPLILPSDEKFIPLSFRKNNSSTSTALQDKYCRLPEESKEYYKQRAQILLDAARLQLAKKLN